MLGPIRGECLWRTGRIAASVVLRRLTRIVPACGRVTETTQAAFVIAISGEAIALVTASIAAVAAAISTCIAAWQGVLMKRSERNRTQPIVVAYERGDPLREGGNVVLLVSLANEGAGPAFNVRFGILLDGAERPYTPRPAGAQGPGDVPRALGPGRTLPDAGDAYRLVVTDIAGAAVGGLESRVYWCRYENAFGDSWETRNAWRPEEELRIRPL
jgi:hypothetical protein